MTPQPARRLAGHSREPNELLAALLAQLAAHLQTPCPRAALRARLLLAALATELSDDDPLRCGADALGAALTPGETLGTRPWNAGRTK